MADNNNNTGKKKESWWRSVWNNFNRLRITLIVIAVCAAIVAAAVLVKSCEGNSISMEVDDKIDITPTQIIEMKEIGEWEFLSVEDEEMVDTIRKGIFTDDYLIRIYYGTLRLGFDLSKAEDGWIKTNGDSIEVTLPPIGLLDDRFIDEARTQSFLESGKWSDQDREAMYNAAYRKMRARCLTASNIKSAETNASRQFRNILESIGYKNIKIRFAKKTGSNPATRQTGSNPGS